MQLREISVNIPFQFIGVDDIDIYVKIRQGKPPTECELINLSKGRQAGYVTGNQEVEKVCVLHVVLEKKDIDSLDNQKLGVKGTAMNIKTKSRVV